MPDPEPGENEKDFIKRCIPYVLHEGTAQHQKQAVAICFSIWGRKGNPEGTPGSNPSGKMSKKLKTCLTCDIVDM